MDNVNAKIKEIDTAGGVKKELSERTIGYVTAAFGIVAGLAWNDAISSLITYLFPISKTNVLMKLVYALLLTFILVIITGYLVKLLKRDD